MDTANQTINTAVIQKIKIDWFSCHTGFSSRKEMRAMDTVDLSWIRKWGQVKSDRGAQSWAESWSPTEEEEEEEAIGVQERKKWCPLAAAAGLRAVS